VVLDAGRYGPRQGFHEQPDSDTHQDNEYRAVIYGVYGHADASSTWYVLRRMSFTYSGSPSSSNKDFVRFIIGDTDEDDQKLQDEEINGAVSVWGNKFKAAAECCRAIAAKAARKVSSAVGDLRAELQQEHQHYLGLAEYYDSKIAVRVKPYAGGISKAEKEDEQDRSDRVRPWASRNQFDYASHQDVEKDVST
jgi:hypothetical protein